MDYKHLRVFGIIAPVAYTIFVVFGGAMTPGYSHTAQAISELTAAGAPHKFILDILFSTYNIMLMAFGIGFLQYVLSTQPPQKSGLAGSWCLIAIGAMGLLTNLLFPMDARGAPATFPGIMHLVLAGLLSLGTILATLLVGVWQIKQSGNKLSGVVSLAACAVIVLTGGFAAAAAATISPLMGLIQRMTIGSFMLWVFFFGVKLTLISQQAIPFNTARLYGKNALSA